MLEELEQIGSDGDERICVVVPDTDPANPREEWDNAWTFGFSHQRYQMGDENYRDAETVKEAIAKNGVTSVPVYMYDHGGRALSTTPFSCPWDSGLLGYAFISDERIRQEWGEGDDARQRALDCLKAELAVYQDYVNGSVYGVMVKEPLEGGDYEVTDSVFGIYGWEQALDMAKEQYDAPLQEAAAAPTGAGAESGAAPAP